jgi:hypothetical protein
METSIRSAWPQIVGQAWADEEFRRRLLEDPSGVLNQLGVEIPEGHSVELLEDTPARTYLVLPRKPADLDSLAAAGPSLATQSRASEFGEDACTACTPGARACTACTPTAACTACTPTAACTACTPTAACTACTPTAACTACTPTAACTACTPTAACTACTPTAACTACTPTAACTACTPTVPDKKSY